MEYYEVEFKVMGTCTVGVKAENEFDAIEKAQEIDVPVDELHRVEKIAIEVRDYEGNPVWNY